MLPAGVLASSVRAMPASAARRSGRARAQSTVSRRRRDTPTTSAGLRDSKHPGSSGTPSVSIAAIRVQRLARRRLAAPSSTSYASTRSSNASSAAAGVSAKVARELHRRPRVEESRALRQRGCSLRAAPPTPAGSPSPPPASARDSPAASARPCRHDRRRHAGAAQTQIRLRRGRRPCPTAAPPGLRDEQRAAGVGERFDARRPARRDPASATRSIALGPERAERRDRCRRADRPCRCGSTRRRSGPTGHCPGAVMPPYCGCALRRSRPRLPAAVTTTMPASTARLAASVSGSVL